MNYQLHRSVTFWSGILVMGFIVWAWSDSFRNDTHVIAHKIVSANCCGGVMILHDETLHSGPLFGGPINAGRGPHLIRDGPRQIFQRPFLLQGKGAAPAHEMSSSPSFYDSCALSMASQGPHVRMIFLPYWLILVAVALPWSALLLWRASRRKRISMP